MNNITVVHFGSIKFSLNETKVALLKILSVLVLSILGGIFHAFTYLLIAAWCLLDVRKALEGLTLVWLLTVLNPAVFSMSGMAGTLRWLPLLASWLTILRLIWSSGRGFFVPRTVIWLTIYVGGVIMLALIGSWMPAISIFKMISFFLGTSTIIIGFQYTKKLADYWEQWFMILFKTILYLSFPLIFLGFGYSQNGVGFQGILIHPQTYGPMMALLLGWFMAKKFPRKDKSKLFWVTVGIGVVTVVASQARTGILVLVGGLMIAGTITLYKTNLSQIGLNRKSFAGAMVMIGVGIIYFALNFNIIIDSFEEFLLKSSEPTTIEESFQSSRGFLINQSMQNFRDHPIVGIGFGIASMPGSMDVKRDPIFGLPIGASVEKGFLPSAILEETGLIGILLFVLLMGSIIKSVFLRKEIFGPLFIVFGALLLNLGEASLLSLGQNGLLIWLLIGYACIEPDT